DDDTNYHMDFIAGLANIRAKIYSILDVDKLRAKFLVGRIILAISTSTAMAIGLVIVPDFQPKQGVKIDIDENVTNLSSASIDCNAVIDELIKKLESHRKILSSGYVMKPIQFKKDDDTNYHMDFIAGLANMRAKNYSIPDVDKLRAKFIVGRIILAIATSTAMATGLVSLELYKVIDEGRKMEDYLNTFANLALPLFSMAEPVPLKSRQSTSDLSQLLQSTSLRIELDSTKESIRTGTHSKRWRHLWPQLPNLVFEYNVNDEDRIYVICWKNLRTLTITFSRFDDDLFRRIISGSPVLETLVLCSCYGFEDLDISNDSVNNFFICGYSSEMDTL
nr:ubiquitin-activating enzyme E1 1-like isoform X2 [Tanacetum cinerariifolium]